MSPLSGHDRCAPSAQRRGDALAGSAAPVGRWLLVEQPGPWGRDAVRQSQLSGAVGDRLAGRARAAGLRLVLIRRYGRPPGSAAPAGDRRWALVDSRPGQESTRWGTYGPDTDLDELPLDGSAGTSSADPTYLVCTHGRHDTCCAIRGRPLAGALAAARPEQTWECSHVGGDHFAANLVVLPHGLYYGHVAPSTGPQLAAAYEAGRVDPTWLRGRSSLSAPVQAAQHHARARLGATGVEDLHPLDAHELDGGRWRVRLADGDGAVVVVVREGRASPQLLTCHSVRPAAQRTWTVEEFSAA